MPHRHRVVRSIALLTLAATVAAITGCDGFKRFDTSAALLTRFNVDTVERDGQQLIRMHSRSARLLVDPVGGRILAYQRHTRPGAFLNSAHPGSIRPNALEAGPWDLSVSADGKPLDPARHWTVDAGTIRLTLLADEQHGLRVRRTFILYDDGVLDLEIMLQNTTFRPVEISAASTLPEAELIRSEGYTRHLRFGDQWLSRRLVDGPADLGGNFKLTDHRLPPLGRIRWTERWWITPVAEGNADTDAEANADVEPPAAEPPSIPARPDRTITAPPPADDATDPTGESPSDEDASDE